MIDMNKHEALIKNVLQHIGSNCRVFLKGGTALRQFYGLDRPSEDIDLDGQGFEAANEKEKINNCLQLFAKNTDASLNKAKDTDLALRYMLHTNLSKPLKIEVSFRSYRINPSDYQFIGAIGVYTINAIASKKVSAYLNRDRIRDLYDIAWIVNEHFDKLNYDTVRLIANAFEYKGLEQYDYLVRTQKDDFIDNDVLLERLLIAHDKLNVSIPNRKDSIASKSDIFVPAFEEVTIKPNSPSGKFDYDQFQRSLSQLRSDGTQKEIGNTSKPCKGFER